jgi:autotransporter-associated beta strand protein
MRQQEEYRCPRRRPISRRLRLVCASAVASTLVGVGSARAALNGSVTFFPIATNAYGYDDTNSCAVSRNNLATVGNYQYTAYYQYDSNSEGTIIVGRRASNSSSWSLINTGINLTNSSDALYSGGIDDHDIVAMAVDGNGDMHLSWGMHNNTLNYAISNAANGSVFNSNTVKFTTQTASNNPALFSQLGTIDQVTYPEFYYVPNSSGTPSGNLLFDYRDAGSASGGGSGNGNTFFGVYNSSSKSFADPQEVLDGAITSVNGYQNRLVYDSKGNLDMTWTWRSTPAFQTNNNILFAQSPNNGLTWTQQGGSPQYTLPIIANNSNGGTGSQVAQVVETIAQNSSLINQASMTVDKNNNPVLATWLTPNGNASLPVSSTNNPNMQYELYYYTGSQWAASQITHRTSDTVFDTNGGAVDDPVRDLGRPIVLVDSSNRVLVIGRSEDTGMGSYDNPNTPNNNLTVYWNTMASLDSANPAPWKSFALDTANMGEYEPSYDSNLWNSSNTLDLFYEPVGLTGETTGTAQVLQWTESTFNFSSATPSVMTWDSSTTAPGILDGGGTWNLSSQNFSDGYANYAWSPNFSNGAIFGAGNGSAGTVTLGATITVSSLEFNAAGSGNYNIAGSGSFSLNLASGTTIVANVNATISAPLITTGTLYKTGPGILTLSGNNTITGALDIGTGATSGGFVNGGICITSAAAVNGLTTIYLADNNSAYGVLQLNGSGGNITLPSSLTLLLNADSAGTNGTAATILESVAGNNTIAGPLTMQVGGSGYGIAVDSGSLTFTGNQTTSAHVLYLRGAGAGSFTGVVSGVGNVEVDGPGIWTFSNTDTYSGYTTITGGTLNISNGASIASATVNVSSGAILNVYGTLSSSTALLANGTVNFQASTGSGILTRTLASLTIGSTGDVSLLKAAPHTLREVLVTATPTFAGTTNTWAGLLDLSNNDLIAHNGSIGTLTNQVKEGFNSGAWNGTAGIISSAAANDSTHLTALGVILNTITGNPSGALLYGSGTSLGKFDGINPVATDVLIKFTYYGDTNLDGKVDGTDYSRIDSAYLNNQNLSNPQLTGWYNGDFNYDSIINGSDYTLIDNAFNSQSTSLSTTAQIASPTAVATAQLTGFPATAVPEPPAFMLMGLGSLAALSRRRIKTA